MPKLNLSRHICKWWDLVNVLVFSPFFGLFIYVLDTFNSPEAHVQVLQLKKYVGKAFVSSLFSLFGKICYSPNVLDVRLPV